VGTLLVMAYKSYKKNSEIAHHAGKALSKDVTTAFERFLALLTTLGAFQTIKQFFELDNIKIIVGVGLIGHFNYCGLKQL
jgi:hypothetical protein